MQLLTPDITQKWERMDLFSLSCAQCRICHSTGVNGRIDTRVNGGQGSICWCVFRRVFRSVMAQYRFFQQSEKWISSARLENGRSEHNRYCWCRPPEEFCADVWLTAKRTLDARHFTIFVKRYIHGSAGYGIPSADEYLSNRGIFHAFYRIEREMGKVWKELQPYPLFPVRDYMRPLMRKESM